MRSDCCQPTAFGVFRLRPVRGISREAPWDFPFFPFTQRRWSRATAIVVNWWSQVSGLGLSSLRRGTLQDCRGFALVRLGTLARVRHLELGRKSRAAAWFVSLTACSHTPTRDVTRKDGALEQAPSTLAEINSMPLLVNAGWKYPEMGRFTRILLQRIHRRRRGL